MIWCLQTSTEQRVTQDMSNYFNKKANVFSSCGVNICYTFTSGAKKLCQMIDKKSIYFISCNKMV